MRRKKIRLYFFNSLLVLSSISLVFFSYETLLRKKDFLPRQYKICGGGDGKGVRFALRPDSEDCIAGVKYRINSLGFRDYEYPKVKPAGSYRIFCVGDSLTFGQGVELPQTYPKQVEKELKILYPGRAVEVINAGVWGYNTRDEYFYIKNRLLKLDPDMVILGFFIGNDPEDPFNEFNQKMNMQNTKKPHLQKYFSHRLHQKQLEEGDYWEKYISGIWEPEGYQWKNCVRALDDISLLCREHNIRLLVAVIPNTEPDPVLRIEYHRQLRGVLEDRGIDYTDTLDAIMEKGRPYSPASKYDYHPGPKIHKIYASEIVKAIEKRGIISGKLAGK